MAAAKGFAGSRSRSGPIATAGRSADRRRRRGPRSPDRKHVSSKPPLPRPGAGWYFSVPNTLASAQLLGKGPMSGFIPPGLGWERDLPDPRDLLPHTETVARLLRGLRRP